MKKHPKTLFPLVLTLLTLVLTSPLPAAPGSETEVRKVKLSGVVVAREGSDFTVLDVKGNQTPVRMTAATQVVEKRKNFLRDPHYFSSLDIQRGLKVEVRGVRNVSGLVVANKVRFTEDNLEVARMIDSNLMQVDQQVNALKDDSGFLAGQMGEIGEQTKDNLARTRGAQRTADQALQEARAVETRVSGVESRFSQLGQSLSLLDDYEVQGASSVQFKAGSVLLEEEARQALDTLAGAVQEPEHLIVEVRGFASSDGDESYNQQLSQKRAESVIHYLILHHGLEPRHFVIPMGYGEMHPVADNSTVDGRRQNRRVEVRLLVNKGLSALAQANP